MKLIQSYKLKASVKDLLNAIYIFVIPYLKERNNNHSIYFGVFEDNKKRSIPQNRYYWGVVLKCISEYTGERAEDLHKLFSSLFIDEEEIHVAGVWVKRQKTSSELNTVEFKAYYDRVRVWAFENSNGVIDIPEPDGVPVSVEMQLIMKPPKRGKNEY